MERIEGSGQNAPLRDALAVMSAWASDADEQAFLRDHVRGLVSHLEGPEREDALIDIVSGLIILSGGLLKVQQRRTGVAIGDILAAIRRQALANGP
jgi:hypothetical protein